MTYVLSLNASVVFVYLRLFACVCGSEQAPYSILTYAVLVASLASTVISVFGVVLPKLERVCGIDSVQGAPRHASDTIRHWTSGSLAICGRPLNGTTCALMISTQLSIIAAIRLMRTRSVSHSWRA